jgi:SAM-dependent methyltransferase
MDRYVRLNQELWEEWTEINYRSAFYDVDGFLKEPPPLDDVVRAGLGDLTGLRVLHLQCHFGMDTLRIARHAAHTTGVDFSPKAIARARELSARTGIAATFVESDVYDLASHLTGEFDVVFTSYGVLAWLPDLERWGHTIARFLAPGGRFFIAEAHPTIWLFDNDASELAVKYAYFPDPEPLVITSAAGNYADPTAPTTKSEYVFAHNFEDIFGALLGNGLQIDELREHAHMAWKAFPFLIEDGPERWVMPPGRPAIPLMFSLRASKR